MTLVPVLAIAAALLGGCDVCAGTPSCHNPPEVSYGGQFIERVSGATVGGVQVEFVRRGGAGTSEDTARATSDASGFFQLRLFASQDGAVKGDLRVTPPAPYPPYVVTGVSLNTSRTRGDGGYLGRLVVNPFLILVGDVYDRRTGAPVPGATITLRRISGAHLSPDTMTLVSDADARVAWIEPTVVEFGVFKADVELSAPGYPRPFHIERDIPISYKDAEISFITLPMGFGLTYSGATSRRGTGQTFPGIQVEFRRTSGIAVQPDPLVLTAGDDGSFVIDLNPLAQGSVTGTLTITPPSPYPKEVIPLTLKATDDDVTPSLGVFGFGTQVFLSAYFRYRDTGLPVTNGISAKVTRVGGLTTLADPADEGIRGLADDGRLVYSAATTETGTTTYDVIVQLAPPFVAETLKAVPVPSRYSDAPTELGVIRVGSWYPWQGIVRDAATDQPIAGAAITFSRTSGAPLSADVYTARSAADGSFPLQPIPRERGTVTGNLTIAATGYSSSVTNGVQLHTTEDDTLRTLGVYRLTRP